MEREDQKPSGFEVNYLYFAFFFAVLILTSGSSIYLKENLSGSRAFFFLYAAGQAALETALFTFICYLFPRYLGKKASLAFIGLTFIFLFLHLIDFFVDRVLDLTLWETVVCFVLDETFDHFLYLLDASGVPLWLWGVASLIIISIPFIGILLYKVTHRLSTRNPLRLKNEWILQSFICIPVALLFWDFTASKVIHPDSYTSFIKSLPWKWTFLQPETIHFPIGHTISTPPTEEAIAKEIDDNHTRLKYKPNIYLFVVESLRNDCITQMVAPNLTSFKETYNQFDLALSNGNGSHLSWFSIFHSLQPYSWNYPLDNGWEKGSGALQLLKKWGYQVRVYTSAQLGYYDMETILFGKDGELIDSYQKFHHPPPLTAAYSDQEALSKLQQDLNDNPELRQGQCIIVFWDTTHFDYSWGADWSPKFVPFSTEVGYFHLFQSSRKIEQIKNRYKNAVSYMDSLFGSFIDNLDDPKSIVIVTGDHGEEFFEHGHLFHNSHISTQQTHIPLYMKLGNTKGKKWDMTISQMDIFPTIFDYLADEKVSFLQGSSIFDPNHPSYAVIARFNAGRAPYEFCIHNGKNKMIAQFKNKKNIYTSDSLTIRSIRDRFDKTSTDQHEDISAWVKDEFGPLINQL